MGNKEEQYQQYQFDGDESKADGRFSEETPRKSLSLKSLLVEGKSDNQLRR